MDNSRTNLKTFDNLRTTYLENSRTTPRQKLDNYRTPSKHMQDNFNNAKTTLKQLKDNWDNSRISLGHL